MEKEKEKQKRRGKGEGEVGGKRGGRGGKR